MDMMHVAPIFGVIFTPLIYAVARRVHQKTNWMLAHPLLVSIIIIISILEMSGITYEQYYSGAWIWNWLVGPATVALAVPLFRQRQILFANWKAVAWGVVSGAVSGVLSVWIVSKLLGLSDQITLSLLPKSVTAPIAIGISSAIHGIPSLTICVTIITGIFGAVVGPTVLNFFRIHHDLSRGLALGAAAHGAGVQQALLANQRQGAVAGLSVGLVGVLAAIIIPILVKLLF